MSLRKLGGFGRQAASYATIASSRASIQPLAHRPGSKVRFGAAVHGVGINKISGECMKDKAKGDIREKQHHPYMAMEDLADTQCLRRRL